MAKSAGKKKRKTAQRKLKRYAKLRDDLQNQGKVAMTPEGAVARPNNPHVNGDAVRPEAQAEQLILDIPLRAAAEGWATDPITKRQVVDEVTRVVLDAETPPVVKVMGANTLGKLDQIQYERDNPEQAGKAKGGTEVNVNAQVNISPFEQYKMELEAAQVDEVAQALEAVDEKAAQQNPGPLQEALAGDEAVRPPA